MTMPMTDAPLVTIIGGSGFVGRYIAQAMAKKGWRVRVACRRPYEAWFVKPYGVVGQVEAVQCNIRDETSTAAAVAGTTAVVNCVGILHETSRQKFGAVQTEGAERAARLAKEAGAQRFIQISAIGSDTDSPAEYGRSKAAGEDAVLKHYPDAIILRPSIIFGTEDEFFNRFAAMSQLSPALPLIGGGKTRFQPVWVKDVADAAAKAAAGDVEPGIYELGGPKVYTFKELMELMLDVIRRRRALVPLPFWAARMKAWFLEKLPNPLLTRDQVELLKQDNVVSDGAKGFAEIGIRPEAAEGVIESYLYVYRPNGQYNILTEDRDSRSEIMSGAAEGRRSPPIPSR